MSLKNIVKPTRKKPLFLVGLFVIAGVFLLISGKKNTSLQSSPIHADTGWVKKYLQHQNSYQEPIIRIILTIGNLGILP